MAFDADLGKKGLQMAVISGIFSWNFGLFCYVFRFLGWLAGIFFLDMYLR